jgi:hypothetical protein
MSSARIEESFLLKPRLFVIFLSITFVLAATACSAAPVEPVPATATLTLPAPTATLTTQPTSTQIVATASPIPTETITPTPQPTSEMTAAYLYASGFLPDWRFFFTVQAAEPLQSVITALWQAASATPVRSSHKPLTGCSARVHRPGSINGWNMQCTRKRRIRLCMRAGSLSRLSGTISTNLADFPHRLYNIVLRAVSSVG